MSVPAFAQNGPQFVPPGDPPNGGNEDLNAAVADLENECEIEQENDTRFVQTNDQSNSALQGFVVVNTGNVNQSNSSNQEQNGNLVVPINSIGPNSGNQDCDAAIVQIQDLLDIFALLGIDRNGPPPKMED